MNTIKYYTDKISTPTQKKIEKLIIRELDEEGENNFVAYLDEGSSSFDVNIKLSANRGVEIMECDCGKPNPCIHLQAVLLLLSGKAAKTASKKVARSKKLNPLEQTLLEINSTDLKGWVKDLLESNKDLQMAFLLAFNKKDSILTLEEIIVKTKEAYKSVVKNRKNIEISELKKIVDLWTILHKTTIENYIEDISNEENFLKINRIIILCINYFDSIKTNSKKIPNYLNSIFLSIENAILNLQNTDDYHKVFTFLIHNLNNTSHPQNVLWLDYAINICNKLPEKTGLLLAQKLIENFKGQDFRNRNIFEKTYEYNLLQIFEKYNLIHENIHLLKPKHFDNEYNIKLIELLSSIGKDEIVVQYCNSIIASNYNEEYNIPYLVYLKNIHIKEQNNKKLLEVLHKLLPLTFDINDYLAIYDFLGGTPDFPKYRTKIYTKARSLRNYSRARMFCFDLLSAEQKHIKMLELLREYTDYNIVIKHFNTFVSYNANLFLQTFLGNEADKSWSSFSTKTTEEDFIVLINLLVNQYSKAILKLNISTIESKSTWATPSKFFEYLKNAINN